MIPLDFIQQFPSVVCASVIASLVGAGCYSICRSLEDEFSAFTALGTIALLVILLVVCSYSFPIACGWMAVVWLPALFGSWFHRRSGGASTNWIEAICTLLIASATSAMATVMLLVGFSLHRIAKPSQITGVAFLLGGVIYAPLSPVAWWIWKSSRLRPGIDEPLRSEEA